MTLRVSYQLMLRKFYCSVNGMLPTRSGRRIYKHSAPEKQFYVSIFNHNNSHFNPRKYRAYPQRYHHLSTIYKSLAPNPKGNTHSLCERKKPGLFGKKRVKIRYKRDGDFRKKLSENPDKQGVWVGRDGCKSLFSLLSAPGHGWIPPLVSISGFILNQWHRIGVYINKRQTKTLLKVK